MAKNCLVFVGPGTQAAGIDLETRLSETGLAAAQLVDYRNFAHGRHYGLARNQDRTTVVAFIAPEYADLANDTLLGFYHLSSFRCSDLGCWVYYENTLPRPPRSEH